MPNPKVEVVGENEVSVTYYVRTVDENDDPVWALDTRNTIVYGRTKLETELAVEQRMKTQFETPAWITEQIANYQDKINKINYLLNLLEN